MDRWSPPTHPPLRTALSPTEGEGARNPKLRTIRRLSRLHAGNPSRRIFTPSPEPLNSPGIHALSALFSSLPPPEKAAPHARERGNPRPWAMAHGPSLPNTIPPTRGSQAALPSEPSPRCTVDAAHSTRGVEGVRAVAASLRVVWPGFRKGFLMRGERGRGESWAGAFPSSMVANPTPANHATVLQLPHLEGWVSGSWFSTPSGRGYRARAVSTVTA